MNIYPTLPSIYRGAPVQPKAPSTWTHFFLNTRVGNVAIAALLIPVAIIAFASVAAASLLVVAVIVPITLALIPVAAVVGLAKQSAKVVHSFFWPQKQVPAAASNTAAAPEQPEVQARAAFGSLSGEYDV